MKSYYEAIQDLLKDGETQLNFKMSVEHMTILYTLRDIYYTLDSTKLSSRNIHHWDKEGILPPTRKSDKGWRKYNFFGMLWLQVVTQLRSMGYPLKSIKVIKEEVFDNIFPEAGKGEYEHLMDFTAWEFIITSAILDDDQLYFVALQDGRYSFVSDRSILIYTMDNTYLQESHVNVPLANLIKHMFDIMPDNDGEHKLGVSWRKPIYEQLSAVEQGIILDARKEDVVKITIKRINNEITEIRTGIEKDVNESIAEIMKLNDWQNIQILRRDGSTVRIYQEEIKKIK